MRNILFIVITLFFCSVLFAQERTEMGLVIGPAFPGGDLVLDDAERAEHSDLAFQGMLKPGWATELSLENEFQGFIGLSSSIHFQFFSMDESAYNEALEQSKVGSYMLESSSYSRLMSFDIGPSFRIIDKSISIYFKVKLGFCISSSPEIILAGDFDEVMIPRTSNVLPSFSIGNDYEFSLNDVMGLFFNASFLYARGKASLNEPFVKGTASRHVTFYIDEARQFNYVQTIMSFSIGIGISFSL